MSFDAQYKIGDTAAAEGSNQVGEEIVHYCREEEACWAEAGGGEKMLGARVEDGGQGNQDAGKGEALVGDQ